MSDIYFVDMICNLCMTESEIQCSEGTEKMNVRLEK